MFWVDLFQKINTQGMFIWDARVVVWAPMQTIFGLNIYVPVLIYMGGLFGT